MGFCMPQVLHHDPQPPASGRTKTPCASYFSLNGLWPICYLLPGDARGAYFHGGGGAGGGRIFFHEVFFRMFLPLPLRCTIDC